MLDYVRPAHVASYFSLTKGSDNTQRRGANMIVTCGQETKPYLFMLKNMSPYMFGNMSRLIDISTQTFCGHGINNYIN